MKARNHCRKLYDESKVAMLDESLTKLTIDYSLILKYFIAVVGVVSIVLMSIPLSITVKFSVILLISIYHLYYLLFDGIPRTIIINQRESILTIISFKHFIQKEESYNYKMLSCTYEKEVGARGGKVMVLKVKDKQGNTLLKVMTNFNGWSNEKLSIIYKKLNN